MKKKLSQFKSLLKLKRNEKLIAEGCYILESIAVASNVYFESKKDIIRAHELISKHLSSVMNIEDYLLTPKGWMLLVVMKSEEDILAQIKRKNYKSKKMKNAIRKKEISIILSECIRYTISAIATKYNKKNERLGTLVKGNFSRYIFGNAECAQEVMKSMKQEQVKLCWQRQRYKATISDCDFEGDYFGSGDVFLCTKFSKNSVKTGAKARLWIQIISNKTNVLREIIESTFSHYFPSSYPYNPPNSPHKSSHNPNITSSFSII